MQIDFRHGIVRTPTANFLTITAGGISLTAQPKPTIFSVAHGDSDYLFIEDRNVANAWVGPFSSASSYYLYWDIDPMTGVRSYGHTHLAPIVSKTEPVSPAADQHWFDVGIDFTMKVWSGTRWVQKIRLFAGKYINGILSSYTVGTQIGFSSMKRKAGTLIFDDAGLPVKRYDKYGRGRFITAEDPLSTQSNNLTSSRIEDSVNYAKATMTIPKYSCIAWRGQAEIGIASQFDVVRPCIGVTIEDLTVDDVGIYKTHGYITNPIWAWLVDPGTPLFVGPAGELTTDVPELVSQQCVGHVVSNTMVFIDIRPQIVFSDGNTDNLVPVVLDRDTGQLKATSNLPNVQVGRLGEITGYAFLRETPAASWLINHELNTTNVIIQTYDENGQQIIPAVVQIVDQDNVTVTFGGSFVAGTATVLGFSTTPPVTTTTTVAPTTDTPPDPYTALFDFRLAPYTVGDAPPAGWSVLQWDTGYTNYEVVTSLVDGEQAVLMSKSTDQGESPLVATTIGQAAEIDIVIKARITGDSNITATALDTWAIIRATGIESTQGYGYVAGLGTITQNRNLFAIERLDGTAGIGGTRLASMLFNWNVDAWYNIRLRGEGPLIRAKVWPAGAQEPGTWMLTAMDNSYTTGYAGFGSTFADGMGEVQVANIAVNGSVAPSP